MYYVFVWYSRNTLVWSTQLRHYLAWSYLELFFTLFGSAARQAVKCKLSLYRAYWDPVVG